MHHIIFWSLEEKQYFSQNKEQSVIRIQERLVDIVTANMRIEFRIVRGMLDDFRFLYW